MPFDLKTLGARLREARKNCGISQHAAAESIGVPRTAITHIEAGNRSVSTLELAQLAELFKRPVGSFIQDDVSDKTSGENLLVALYRIAPGLDSTPKVSEEVSRCWNLCRDGYAIEQMLGRGTRGKAPTYDLAAPQRTGHAVEQAIYVANQERQRLGLGSASIADMAELIAGQGIWVSGAILPSEMSGLFLCDDSIGMAILVNFKHVRTRKRFSYAHEYGHALMDRDRAIITATTRDNSSELVEKRANAFAASFLMPSAGVDEILESLSKGQPSRLEMMVYDVARGDVFGAKNRNAPGSQAITYQDVALIAHHFGVSYQAATYRLMSLKKVTRSQGDSLLEMEGSGKKYLKLVKIDDDPEEYEINRDRELISQIVHLALEAYRRQEISKGRLLDLSKKLKVSGNELVALAEAAIKA